MKKIIVSLSLILVMLVAIMGTVHAANGSMSLQTSQNEYNKNEELVVNVVLSGITTQKGVAALMATLEYDEDSLTLVKMEGQNDWTTPSYNEANGKLITDKNSNITGTETVLKITFKVKEEAKQNLVVTLKNITVSGGDGDIVIERAYKELTVKDGVVNPKPTPGEDNSSTNQTPNTNGEGTLNVVSNTVNGTASGKLPQTGSYNTVFVVGGVIASIAAVIFFIRMRMVR